MSPIPLNYALNWSSKQEDLQDKIVILIVFVVFISGNFTCNLDFLADIVLFTSNNQRLRSVATTIEVQNAFASTPCFA